MRGTDARAKFQVLIEFFSMCSYGLVGLGMEIFYYKLCFEDKLCKIVQ